MSSSNPVPLPSAPPTSTDVQVQVATGTAPDLNDAAAKHLFIDVFTTEACNCDTPSLDPNTDREKDGRLKCPIHGGVGEKCAQALKPGSKVTLVYDQIGCTDPNSAPYPAVLAVLVDSDARVVCPVGYVKSPGRDYINYDPIQLYEWHRMTAIVVSTESSDDDVIRSAILRVPNFAEQRQESAQRVDALVKAHRQRVADLLSSDHTTSIPDKNNQPQSLSAPLLLETVLAEQSGTESDSCPTSSSHDPNKDTQDGQQSDDPRANDAIRYACILPQFSRMAKLLQGDLDALFCPHPRTLAAPWTNTPERDTASRGELLSKSYLIPYGESSNYWQQNYSTRPCRIVELPDSDSD